MKFAKGDRFKITKNFNCQMEFVEGDTIVITMVGSDDEYPYYRNERTDDSCSGHTNAFEDGSLIKLTGETTMEQEAPAKYVRLERNTELFKKGEVFENNGSYYSALSGRDAFIDTTQNGVTSPYLHFDVVKRLGVKVFAPVQKFNPAYVTVEEDERLQAVLKAPAAKKATAKKATK